MRITLFIFVVLVTFPSSADATVRNVPGTYSTIQDGINAAVAGDTVLVQPGTYTGIGNKDLDYGEIDIVVRSSGGASVTTIDCQNVGRGVNFVTSESNAAVLDGFTITNGESIQGAAININGSSPTISNCAITGNNVDVIVWGL